MTVGRALRNIVRAHHRAGEGDPAVRVEPDHAGRHRRQHRVEQPAAPLDLPGRLEEALASHDVAVRLKPESADAHNNRGNALMAMGKAYGNLIRSNPNRLRALIGSFANGNPTRFNAPDGSGYDLLERMAVM